jgi:hypothetical protein
MNTDGLAYMETSVAAGALFITLGVGIWVLHYTAAIFTSWTWAALIGNLWVITGALLLFSDIRVYQFNRSPVEQLLVDQDEE